jgi:hypothetical protein
LPADPLEPQDTTTEIVLDITDVRFYKVVLSHKEYTVETVSPGRFIVRKGGSVYYVGLEKSRNNSIFASCNCPDWNFHARKLMVPCKHIWLTAQAEGLVTFPDARPETI